MLFIFKIVIHKGKTVTNEQCPVCLQIVLMAGLIVLIASTYTTLNTPDKLPEVVSLDNGLVDDHPADIAKIMNKREGPEEGIYKGDFKKDVSVKYH